MTLSTLAEGGQQQSQALCQMLNLQWKSPRWVLELGSAGYVLAFCISSALRQWLLNEV